MTTPGGMDGRRKPRTIGDLLDDAPFEALLWTPEERAGMEMHRRGREAIREVERAIEVERELGISRRPWPEDAEESPAA